jgi:hypothetical protein
VSLEVVAAASAGPLLLCTCWIHRPCSYAGCHDGEALLHGLRCTANLDTASRVPAAHKLHPQSLLTIMLHQ